MFVNLPINKMAFVMKTTIFSMSCKLFLKKNSCIVLIMWLYPVLATPWSI